MKITVKEFYNLQNLTPSAIKEINKWFDKNKPDRRSLKVAEE